MPHPRMRSQLSAAGLVGFAYMQAPVGWDSDTPAQFMPESMAQRLDNFIPRNGKLTIRQPFSTFKTTNPNGDWQAAGSNPLNIRGFSSANGGIFGVPTVFSAGSPQWTNDEGLWAWQVGKVVSSASYGAGAAGATEQALPQGDWFSNGPSPYPLDPGVVGPGKSSTSLFGFDYYVSLPTTAGGFSAIGGQSGDCDLVAYDGVYSNLSATAGAPRSCTAVCAYQSRLWVLGGLFQGETTKENYSPNALMFSNPLAPSALLPAASVWADPISGTKNRIYVNPDSSDPALGLAAFNQRLIIFRFKSVYVLLGTTPANYSVQLLSDSIGCVDQQSIVETGQGVYFVSEEGLCLTTGTSVANVSGSVQQSLAAAVQRYRQAVGQGGTGDCTAVKLLNGDILISIRLCHNGSSANTLGFDTIWSGVYSPATGTWYRVTSQLFANGDTISTSLGGVDCPPGYLVTAQSGVVSVGNRRGVIIEGPGAPAMASTDVNPPGGGYPTNKVLSGMDIQQAAAPTVYPIPARWVSSFVPLAPGGRYHSTGVRWFADYLLQQDVEPTGSGDVPPFKASLLTVSAEEITSANLPVTFNDPSTDFPGPEISGVEPGPLVRMPVVQRVSNDFAEEMEHAILAVEFAPGQSGWGLTQPTLKVAEILGVGVEFQQGRNLEALTLRQYN